MSRLRPIAALVLAGALVVALATPGGAGGFSGAASLVSQGLGTDHLLDHVALRERTDDPGGVYATRPGDSTQPVAVPAAAKALAVESVLPRVGAVGQVPAARTAGDGAAMTLTEASAGGVVLFPANRTFDTGDTGWTSSHTGSATPAYSPSQGNPTGALRVQLVGGLTNTEGTATWSTRFTYSDGMPTSVVLSYDQRTMLSGSLTGDNDWQVWLDLPGGTGSVQLDRKVIVVGPGPEGSELAFRRTTIAVPPDRLAAAGTYGLRILTRLSAAAATDASTATGASVVYDNVELRVQRAQRAVPQNQGFDTDSSGWTSVSTGTAVGSWSPSDGQPPGSLRASLAGSTTAASGSVLWEGTFFRAAPTPGSAQLHYEKRILLGDNLVETSRWEVRLRAPSGAVTLLSDGKLVPGPYPGLEPAWVGFDVAVSTSLLQEVGTYGLQVYTLIETKGGGAVDGVSVAYDNVRLSLSGAPQMSAPENRTFDTSLGWSSTTTGGGTARWSATHAALVAGVEGGVSAASGTATWQASFPRSTGRPDTAYLSYATRTLSCTGTVDATTLEVVLSDPAGTRTVLDRRAQACGTAADGSEPALVRHAPVAVPVDLLAASGTYVLGLVTTGSVGAASAVEVAFDDVRLETSALGYQADATAHAGFAGTTQAVVQLRAWTSGEAFVVDLRRDGAWTAVGQVAGTTPSLLEIPVVRATDTQAGVVELRLRGTVEMEDTVADVLHVDSLVVVPVADPREHQGVALSFGTVSLASDHLLHAVLRVVNPTQAAQRIRIATDPGVLSYAALLPDPADPLVTNCVDQVRDGSLTLSLECTLAPGAVVPVSMRLTGNAAQGTGTYSWAVTVSATADPQFLRYRVLGTVTVV